LIKVFSPKIPTSWDQIHEDEADRLALGYMLRRDYDPRAVKSFYANLQRASKEEANLQFGFTATEQRIAERMRTVESEAVLMNASIPAKPPKPPGHVAIDPAARTPGFIALMAVVKRDNGFRAFQSDLFRIARANLAEALLLRSDNPVAHYYKGKVWMATARETADKSIAVEAFRRAVNLDTANRLPEPRLHLALAVMDGGRLSGRQEITSLLKEYVRIYKATHNGAAPQDLDSISEYLRDTNAKGGIVQTAATVVKAAEKIEPQPKTGLQPSAEKDSRTKLASPASLRKPSQSNGKPKNRKGEKA